VHFTLPEGVVVHTVVVVMGTVVGGTYATVVGGAWVVGVVGVVVATGAVVGVLAG
jgi:hypothetical protein